MRKTSTSPATTVYDISDEQWIRRLHDRSAGRALATTPQRALSDGEKYRWIRANRGNFAVVEALNDSTCDADFDERIEAAMRMSVEHLHY